MELSIVIPCHNEEGNLDNLMSELSSLSSQLLQQGSASAAEQPDNSSVPTGPADKACVSRVQVVLVDDGSQDNTRSCIREAVCQSWPFRVSYVSFSRNFGKEAALVAGLERATGDLVSVMDADLQDPPQLLLQMVDRLLHDTNVDCVAACRVSRTGEPPLRTFFSKRFYRVINALSDTKIVDGARDFRIMRRPMVDTVLALNERNRFSKGIFSWVGFTTEWLEYEAVPRNEGVSSWSFLSLWRYAIDGIAAFSTLPLQVASVFGVIFFLIAIVSMLFIIVRTLVYGDPVAGWPSTISILLLVGGLQLLCLGVIGQYLAKTYMETKGRPLYVVKEEGEDPEPS